jgi:pseudouridine synthase, rluA family
MIVLKLIHVEENDVGKRIDSYLASNTESSRVTIQRLIENEKVLVNGKKTKDSYKIQLNDEITIEEEKPKEIELKAQDIPVEILYEDKDIIVVNKTKGMVVHPANGNLDGTLVNAVMAICKDSLSGIGGEIRPGIVHRLDKDTSGAIIVAKNDKAHINLSEQIKNHQVEKTYIALVKGFVKENEATINMPIGRSTKDRKKMAVNKNGKNAVTHFKVIERFRNYTLLEVKIETGRTHQIRVHLSEIGYPIVGDTVYSNGKNEWNIEGQCLHAKSLKFKHPITGKEMFIEAPLPEYFKNVILELKKRETNGR